MAKKILRIEGDLHSAVKGAASVQGKTLNEFVAKILRDALPLAFKKGLAK